MIRKNSLARRARMGVLGPLEEFKSGEHHVCQQMAVRLWRPCSS